MAWKKSENGRFTTAQREKMYKMYKGGAEISEIAEKAGCAWSTVDNVLKSVLKKLSTKKKVGTKRKKMPSALNEALNGTDPAEEAAYLMWALRGSMNKVGGIPYLERLAHDFRNGRFD